MDQMSLEARLIDKTEPSRIEEMEAAVDLRLLRPISEAIRERFLLLISEGHSIRRAADAVNRPRLAFKKLIDTDPEFAERYAEAFEASADDLEDEAWRRSHERGRYRLGSDRLLEMGLKARRPGRYSDRLQVTGPGGGPLKAIVATVDHGAVLDLLREQGLVAPALEQGSE